MHCRDRPPLDFEKKRSRSDALVDFERGRCWVKVSLVEDRDEAKERVEDEADSAQGRNPEKSDRDSSSTTTAGVAGSSCVGGALGGRDMCEVDDCRITTRGEVGSGAG